MKTLFGLVCAVVLGSASAGAYAHALHTGGTAFSAGFAHPLMGLDHMLAMVAIGLYAAHAPLRARGGILLAAALALSGGVLVGHTIAAGALLEFLALTSVGALAVLLLCVRKLLPLYGMAAVVLFALVHGALHANEQPIEFATTAYTAGVLLSSTALQFLGNALGVLSRGRVHWYGLPLAASGSWILFGAAV